MTDTTMWEDADLDLGDEEDLSVEELAEVVGLMVEKIRDQSGDSMIAMGGDVEVRVCPDFDHLIFTKDGSRGGVPRLVVFDINPGMLGAVRAMCDHESRQIHRRSDRLMLEWREVFDTIERVANGDMEAPEEYREASAERNPADSIEEDYEALCQMMDDFINDHLIGTDAVDTNSELGEPIQESFYSEKLEMDFLSMLLDSFANGVDLGGGVLVGEPIVLD